MLKLGTTDIADMKLGTTQVLKAYLGTTLVWEKGSGPEPEPIPVPSPGPYNVSLTSVQSGASVSLTWNGGSVSGTDTVNTEIAAGTLVTYTVTYNGKTESDTVIVLRPTTLLIDVEAEKYSVVASSLSRQDDSYFFERFYARFVYEGFDAAFLLEMDNVRKLKFPVGTTSDIYLSDPMYNCTRSSKVYGETTGSYGTWQNGILTVNFTPTDADIFVHDQFDNLIPPINIDRVNGVATFYNCNFVINRSTVTVIAKKDGYADKSVSYTPGFRQNKTVTINL